jgi:electron transfer flavoprotein alpha subunit
MSGVLVLAEPRRGELREVSLELVAAGRELKDGAGGRLVVAVAASSPSSFAEQLNVEGVDTVLTVETPVEHFDPNVQEQVVEKLIEEEDPSLVVVGFTIDSLGFAPALAARLGLGFASDVTAVSHEDGGFVARRGFYAGKVETQLEFPNKDRVLIMLRAGAFEPAGGEGSAEVRPVEVPLQANDLPIEHLDFKEAEAGDVDITASEFLLSIGRGIEDQDNISQFEELAEKMGATLSVSRPLVDSGWIPNSRQVGQSGKTVKPKVYLALGISGAVQHLAGISGAETIIAVNTDPEAPIFGVAQYGATADLFDVADELGDLFG